MSKLLDLSEQYLEKCAGIFGGFRDKSVEGPKKEPEVAPKMKDIPKMPQPLQHNIPEGRVEQKYQSFPVLKNITADQIRITPNAASHIVGIFMNRLHSINENYINQNPGIENKIINEVKKAVVKGIVLNNYPSDDTHNPLDRQLEIYSFIELKNIIPDLNSLAKLKILCRLSLNNRTLTLRTISKNFEIG